MEWKAYVSFQRAIIIIVIPIHATKKHIPTQMRQFKKMNTVFRKINTSPSSSSSVISMPWCFEFLAKSFVCKYYLVIIMRAQVPFELWNKCNVTFFKHIHLSQIKKSILNWLTLSFTINRILKKSKFWTHGTELKKKYMARAHRHRQSL